MRSSTGPKIHKKKHKAEKDEALVDLRLLLIECATSIAAGNRLTANVLLKQIRQHSSPFGDATQRLAHYFAHGLEARLAGTGSLIHKIADPSDNSKAYLVACASSWLMKISSFVTNKMIMIESEKAARDVVHIIDFGILYGFQWPAFIKCVAERAGGPPKKLRITGVDFPRAAEIIEEAGHRLARYAEKFGVPFEYKAIVREWETIKIEDLKIEEGEFVAVVCSLRAMNLMDETVGVGENPRAMFLKLIREIKPDIFVHGIVNGAYNEPFFVYRFRELLLHFLALFDMVETFAPRDKPERMLIERNILGKRAMNVIACEGWDRIERPETYKQWQVRHVKAGFMKVPFERKLVDIVMDKVNNSYHRDFVIGEDNKWLLMSWKGRTMYAISCWEPV
ncbi:scarecrow-like protein 9 [Phtheirospermum japonicum]|uniref:Scarecrow-like protein 9 n=1 Tax=Phtheirospermum japonicum TaxID=374723 RepID=A0A830CD96_9LAMI|nr:scarecrow-like protein 9 [Phtheirospermum japonicum]